jgi:hypothetical protein
MEYSAGMAGRSSFEIVCEIAGGDGFLERVLGTAGRI